MILLLPVVLRSYSNMLKREKKRKQWRLNIQFQDALSGMTAALSAGYSVENSISETLVSLGCIYKENEMIVRQYVEMAQKIKLNTTIEEVFFDFARKSKIDDVQNFAWILYTAKRTGGDLVKITKRTNSMISERIEVNREIQTMISGKQLEAKVMNIVPLGIIIYLKLGCAGILDPLYHNVAGAFVMTVVLVIYLITYEVSQRIAGIEV